MNRKTLLLAVFRRLLPIFAVLFATVPLLNLSAWFYHDWEVHSWFLSYTTMFLRAHWSFPKVFSFADTVGFPLPLFYATTLYPAIGIMSLPFGIDLGIRFGVWAALLGQFFSVRTLFRSSEKTASLGSWAAVLSLWAIYPMTNLFNRSAIPEFFALTFLTTGIAQFFLLLQAPQHSKYLHLFSAILSLGLAFTTHPITALYAVLLSGPLLLIAWNWSDIQWKEKLQRVLGLASGIAVSASAWIYICARYQKLLRISSAKEHIHHFHDIDVWYARLMPFPFDFRTTLQGAVRQETPFLEAQINWSLLVLAGFFAWRVFRKWEGSALRCFRRYWECSLLMVLTTLFLAFSLFVDLWDIRQMLWIGRTTQFMYRLVGHINILLLVTVFALLKRTAETGSAWRNSVLAIAMTLAVTNVGTKIVHAMAVAGPGMFDIDTNARRLVNKRSSWIPLADYAMDIFPPEPTTGGLSGKVTAIQFQVDHETKFGKTHSSWVNLEQESLVLTNVMAFPWNEILVDEVPVAKGRYYQRNHLTEVLVPAGKHEITFRTTPDPIWRVLSSVSRLLLGFCFLTVAILLTGPRLMALVRFPYSQRKLGRH